MSLPAEARLIAKVSSLVASREEGFDEWESRHSLLTPPRQLGMPPIICFVSCATIFLNAQSFTSSKINPNAVLWTSWALCSGEDGRRARCRAHGSERIFVADGGNGASSCRQVQPPPLFPPSPSFDLVPAAGEDADPLERFFPSKPIHPVTEIIT